MLSRATILIFFISFTSLAHSDELANRMLIAFKAEELWVVETNRAKKNFFGLLKLLDVKDTLEYKTAIENGEKEIDEIYSWNSARLAIVKSIEQKYTKKEQREILEFINSSSGQKLLSDDGAEIFVGPELMQRLQNMSADLDKLYKTIIEKALNQQGQT